MMIATEKSMDLLNAQAGARGDIALAALEVMEAREAVRASRLYVQNPGMPGSALSGLVESCRIRIKDMMNHARLMEQAAEDLVLGDGRFYEC